ncbi:hypothetical protein CALVIDRAFT_598626 [Calocera viscosa TUFC12733]|uniref:Uncharacterized protein n=1 Tax=Calocera viscosa (strain TUFC12733) TaxID=1330018 RepID=A0A167LQA5_CALVF|nr:hypothetical protein CALVIDRAFT_598626 [Calocera viscosa TUFC12733]
MILTASHTTSGPPHETVTRSSPHTRTHSRKRSTNQNSEGSSSTSSSHPSTQPSELFDHDMTSPSSSVPVSDGYDEAGVEQELTRNGKQMPRERQMLSVDMDMLGEEDELDDDTSRVTVTALTSRPMGGAPVSPARLAKLANAFGVSTPIPPGHDTQSPHQFGFSSHSHARASATRFLIHVIPPSSLAVDPSADAQLKRGALVPLHSTLKGQLGAVAKEYRLPSTSGMVLYLIQEDPDGPAAGVAGPRVSDEAWKLLWQPLLRMERDELVAAVTSPQSASVVSHSPVPSPPTTLHESPVDDASTSSPRAESRVLRPLNTSRSATVTPSPQKRAFPFASGKPSPLEQHENGRTRQDSIASLASVTSSRASRPSTALSVLQPPIVGKVEFDIERHKAPWFDIWLSRTRGRSAAPSPSPSFLNGPLPLQLPSRATSRANSRMGSRAVSSLGSRSPRSPLFKFDGDAPLPSPAMLRSDDGLLSPGNHNLMYESEPHSILPDTPYARESSESQPETPGEPEEAEYMHLEDEEADVTFLPDHENDLESAEEPIGEEEVSPRSEYEEDEDLEDEEEKHSGEEDELPAIPALSLNSDPLGDVFPPDGQTWSALRNSASSHMAQSAHSQRSSATSGMGLGIRMNGVPYSPSIHEHELTPEEPADTEELTPPSPSRFDEEGNGSGSGSGTDWDSTDDVEDVVSLWNAKHTPEVPITRAQLRDELRESLRQPITLVEVSRASREMEKDEVDTTGTLSPEPVHSPSTVTPGGSRPSSATHSRTTSTGTATAADSPTLVSSPESIQLQRASVSPRPAQPRRSAPPPPLQLAPSPLISDKIIEREEAEKDSPLSLAYLSTQWQSNPHRQSSVDSEADSLRASQIRMQRELDDIEKAYAQISPRQMSTTSFMDLNTSPDLNSSGSTPVFPGPGGKPAGLLVSGWPAIPVSPTVAQQGLNGLMAPGVFGSEDRPFAPATVSMETLKRARSAEEEGMNVSPDKKDRRSTKSPSIIIDHERNESIRSRDSSRFSEDSFVKGDIKTERKRSVMSMKSIRRLWKKGAQGSLQGVPEAESPPLPSPRSPIPPSPRQPVDLAGPRVSTSSSADSASDSHDKQRDSRLDNFRFGQDTRLSVRSPTPNAQVPSRIPPVPPIPQTDKTTSLRSTRTKSVLNKWASPKLRPGRGDYEDDAGVTINGRAVTISAPMHVIHGQADLRDARFASQHRAAPSPPQTATGSPPAPVPPPKHESGTAPASRPPRSSTPVRLPQESPATRPARQNSIRRKPVPGLDEVGEDGVVITHSPASSVSRTHHTGPSISASLLSQSVQEEDHPRPSMSSSTDDQLSPTELSHFEMVTPVGYAHIRSSPAF